MKIDENTSDGYHTFLELYQHRAALLITLMKAFPTISWWSRKHDDGSMFEGGWIIAGMHLPTGDITYHLKDHYVEHLEDIKELDNAPKWDGHDPQDVLFRLLAIQVDTPIKAKEDHSDMWPEKK